MPKQTITLISPHPVDECRRRLKENVSSAWITIFSDKKLAGSVYANSFEIRKKIDYQNSFQIFLFGTFQSDQNGTIISGKFDRRPSLKLFKYLWVGFLTLIEIVAGIPALIFIIKNGIRNSGDALMAFFVPTFLILLGIVLLFVVPKLADDEPEFIKNFLMQLLDAQEAGSQFLVNSTSFNN